MGGKLDISETHVVSEQNRASIARVFDQQSAYLGMSKHKILLVVLVM